MTWFDGLLLGFVTVCVFIGIRREAGVNLMDTVAALLAIHYSAPLGAFLTGIAGWAPAYGADVAPAARLLVFLALWLPGLLLSRVLHRQFRWSAEPCDPIVGAVLATVLALSISHLGVNLLAQQAVLKQGRIPSYIRQSWLGEELRWFRSYYYVLDMVDPARFAENP